MVLERKEKRHVLATRWLSAYAPVPPKRLCSCKSPLIQNGPVLPITRTHIYIKSSSSHPSSFILLPSISLSPCMSPTYPLSLFSFSSLLSLATLSSSFFFSFFSALTFFRISARCASRKEDKSSGSRTVRVRLRRLMIGLRRVGMRIVRVRRGL